MEHELEHLRVDLLWIEPDGEWYRQYGPRRKDENNNGIVDGCDDPEDDIPCENDFDDDEIPNAVEDYLQGIRWDDGVTDPTFYLQGDDEETKKIVTIFLERLIEKNSNK